MSMRRMAMIGAAGVLAGMGALVPATASAATTTDTSPQAGQVRTAPAPCGFYENNRFAFYNHCGPTNVLVKVDGSPNVRGFKCLHPGVNPLGPKNEVENAYYAGRAC